MLKTIIEWGVLGLFGAGILWASYRGLPKTVGALRDSLNNHEVRISVVEERMKDIPEIKHDVKEILRRMK